MAMNGTRPDAEAARGACGVRDGRTAARTRQPSAGR